MQGYGLSVLLRCLRIDSEKWLSGVVLVLAGIEPGVDGQVVYSTRIAFSLWMRCRLGLVSLWNFFLKQGPAFGHHQMLSLILPDQDV